MSRPAKTKNFSNTPQTTGSALNVFNGHTNKDTQKNRTANVNTNRLSPPPGINLGSNISRLNLDSLKSKNQNDKYSKYRNMQNLPNVSEKSKSSLTNSKQKQFVSMEEALGFLNYINSHQNEAFVVENIPLEEINLKYQNPTKKQSLYAQSDAIKKVATFGYVDPSTQKTPLRASSSGQLKSVQENSGGDSHDNDQINETKKKLNKNRAIKRIIETAFGILQKNYRYGSEEWQGTQDERSIATQFNIYLKQYNRILEQINSKELQEIQNSNNLYEKNEQELQDVFEYTVTEDFREKLSLVFSKEKVSKNNVDMMISAFREGLVVLRLNELKIQFIDSQEPVKLIKLSEVQNVEYFTHPYIFIVLTINKDKTKSKQYLYLKFCSEQNQDKWDRALYCCFMSRKMNKKDRLFQIEFPVQDVMKKEKQEHVKDEQMYLFKEDYSVIHKCFQEDNEERASLSKQTNYDPEIDRNMLSDRPEYMNLSKNRNFTEQKITISIINAQNAEDARRLNTVQNKTSKNDNPFRNGEVNLKDRNLYPNQNRNQGLQSMQMIPGQNNEGKSQENFFQRKQSSLNNQPQSQQSGNLSKKSTLNMNVDAKSNSGLKNGNSYLGPPSNTSDNPLSKLSSGSIGNPFLKLLKIAQEVSEKQKMSQNKSRQKAQQKNEENPKNEQRNFQMEQKLKRIRQIQKANVRGIVCQKQKFFMNKQKIIFFHDQGMISSARKISELGNISSRQGPRNLQTMNSKQIRQNKFIEYWDYDYKKDLRSQRKLIPLENIIVCQIIPSVLGQTTTTLHFDYNIVEGGKVERKQLKLIFANAPFTTNHPSKYKADQVYEWIHLVKEL